MHRKEKFYFLRVGYNRSRVSVVGIATSYELNDRRVGDRVPVGSRIFTSPNRPHRLWGPPNLLSKGYGGALSPGVRRPGREVDHSPPTSAEIKKMWIYTSTPIHLHGIVLNYLRTGTTLPLLSLTPHMKGIRINVVLVVVVAAAAVGRWWLSCFSILLHWGITYSLVFCL
jgi:hypothetical protein